MNTPTSQTNQTNQATNSVFNTLALSAIKDKFIPPASREQKNAALKKAAESMALQIRSKLLISSVLIAALDWINDPMSDLLGTTLKSFAQKIERETGCQRTAIYRYFDNMTDIVITVLSSLKESGIRTESLTKKERALISFYGI